MPHHTDTIAALSAIVGPTHCLSAPADTVSYTTDYRKLYRGTAIAVVLPGSTEEVSQVVTWCHGHGIRIVPQGGNTSLMGGAVPDDAGDAIVLNLRRMARVLAVDTLNDTMTLQAGVTLSGARAAAEGAERLFPLRIGSEGSCQIGGNIATNAGGTAAVRSSSRWPAARPTPGSRRPSAAARRHSGRRGRNRAREGDQPRTAPAARASRAVRGFRGRAAPA